MVESYKTNELMIVRRDFLITIRMCIRSFYVPTMEKKLAYECVHYV